MCSVSMVMDHQQDIWTGRLKETQDLQRVVQQQWPQPIGQPAVTQQEIIEFRKLLERAREYDKRNNQPDCELQEKKDKVLALAKELGIEINFL